jgi:hypothetical protein
MFIKTEGLEGATLDFAKRANEAFENLPKGIDEKALQTQLREAGIIDSEGKATLNVEEMKTLLADENTDGSIRSILKAQGEKLNKVTVEQKPEKVDFRSIFDTFLDKAKEVHARETGEVAMSLRKADLVNLGLEKRAAGEHETGNGTIDSSALPDDLVHSFSVGEFIDKRRPYEFVFDFANRNTVAKVEKYKRWQEEGNEEGAFALVDEGGLKPLVQGKLVDKVSTAKKIAGKIIVSDEFEKWRRDALNQIRRLVRQKIVRDYAVSVTNDLVTNAPSYTGTDLDGTIPANLLTDYHAIGALAAQIETLEFMPDTLFINPQDKWRLGLSQDADGAFYLNIPAGTAGIPTMLGFTVITSTRVTAGSFGLAESGLWNLEEEAIRLKAGYGISVTKDGANVTEVEHDLDHNRFRVILEMYFHSFIGANNGGSYAFDTFANIRTALTKV